MQKNRNRFSGCGITAPALVNNKNNEKSFSSITEDEINKRKLENSLNKLFPNESQMNSFSRNDLSIGNGHPT
jgi:hypothetical protein